MTTREDLVECAVGYINTPFRMNGRSRRGIDCVGIPLALARDLRVRGWQRIWADPECNEYARIRPNGFLRAKLDHFVELGLLRHIDVNRLECGDLVLRWAGFNRDHHVSLIYHDEWIIEASMLGERRFPRGRVRKIVVMGRERSLTFLGGYQFSEVV